RPARFAVVVAAVKRAPAHPAPRGRELTRDPLVFLLKEREELALERELLHHRPPPVVGKPGGKPPRWTFSSFLRGLLSASLRKVDQDASWGPPPSWRCSHSSASDARGDWQAPVLPASTMDLRVTPWACPF